MSEKNVNPNWIPECSLCKNDSQFEWRIENLEKEIKECNSSLEKNTKELYDKIDANTRLLIASLVSTILALLGIAAMFLTK